MVIGDIICIWSKEKTPLLRGIQNEYIVDKKSLKIMFRIKLNSGMYTSASEVVRGRLASSSGA